MARLADKLWCITFVTVGEMTQWAQLRSWSPRNQSALDAWLSERVLLDAGAEMPPTWGTPLGRRQATRPHAPDQRLLDRPNVPDRGPATGHVQHQGLRRPGGPS